MSVIGKTVKDNETKELLVGRLTQVKTELIREYRTVFTLNPDDLNLL